MFAHRGFRSLVLFACVWAAGCAGSSNGSSSGGASGAIAIKTLLDNPSQYNDKSVRIEGTGAVLKESKRTVRE